MNYMNLYNMYNYYIIRNFRRKHYQKFHYWPIIYKQFYQNYISYLHRTINLDNQQLIFQLIKRLYFQNLMIKVNIQDLNLLIRIHCRIIY